MWREAVHDFEGFPGIDGEVKIIIRTAREVGGEGFVDMIDGEVEDLVIYRGRRNRRRTSNVNNGKIWLSVSDGTKLPMMKRSIKITRMTT